MSGYGTPPPGAAPAPAPETSMTEIPFSEAELGNLTMTSRAMFFAGILTIAAAAVEILSGIVVAVLARQGGQLIGTLCSGLISGGIAAVLGAWLIMGSRAVARVVATDEADQTYLVDALRKLRNVFLLKAILIIVVILLFCVVAGGAAAIGLGAAAGGGRF